MPISCSSTMTCRFSTPGSAAARRTRRIAPRRPARQAVARAAITAALALLSLAAPPALGQTVIPRPLSSEAIIGRAPVAIADGATIAVRAGDPGARRAAGFLSNAVQRSRGLRLRVGAGGRTPTIVLERAGVADAGAEGYRIDIGDGRVVIAAPTNAGLFYGAVTLTQL